MPNSPKLQPQEPKPIQPAKPSENPGTPIQKNPLPVRLVRPSLSPGTRIPFSEPGNKSNIKGGSN